MWPDVVSGDGVPDTGGSFTDNYQVFSNHSDTEQKLVCCSPCRRMRVAGFVVLGMQSFRYFAGLLIATTARRGMKESRLVEWLLHLDRSADTCQYQAGEFAQKERISGVMGAARCKFPTKTSWGRAL